MSWDWEELKRRHQDGNKKKHSDWKLYTVSIIVVIIIVVIMWFPIRWIHYKLSYQTKVKQQIIEMVKPESLKDKYKR